MTDNKATEKQVKYCLKLLEKVGTFDMDLIDHEYERFCVRIQDDAFDSLSPEEWLKSLDREDIRSIIDDLKTEIINTEEKKKMEVWSELCAGYQG